MELHGMQLWRKINQYFRATFWIFIKFIFNVFPCLALEYFEFGVHYKGLSTVLAWLAVYVFAASIKIAED